MSIQTLKPAGRFKIEIISKDGVVKHTEEFDNGVTTVGRNLMLDVMFHGGSASGTWYIGFIDNSGYTAVAAADTLASKAWNEFTTYDESTRQAWTEGAASAGSITSSSVSTFTIAGSGTLRGIFVADNSTKSGTTGTLWSTALFASPTAVADDDQIKITYTVNLT